MVKRDDIVRGTESSKDWALQAWLRLTLTERYGSTLDETLPGVLVELLKQ